ncbi:MAG: hypothetical protein ABH883_04420 [Candidatus Omnitrophota bacterium]
MKQKQAVPAPDISVEKEKLRKAFESKDEAAFNKVMIEITRKKAVYDEELEDILLNVSEQYSFRMGNIASGYLKRFGGEKTARKFMGKLIAEGNSGSISAMEIRALGAIARRNIIRREIVSALSRYLIENSKEKENSRYPFMPSNRLPFVVYTLDELGEYDAFPAFLNHVREFIKNKDYGQLVDPYGMDINMLRALVLCGREGEEVFCEIVKTGYGVKLEELRNVAGYRLSLKEQKELDGLLREKALTPDNLFRPKDPGNRYHYYHGTLLGLVKTAVETKAGLLGRESTANVTPEKSRAGFWSEMRMDHFFMDDDDYEKTRSNEELNGYMSPETQKLPEEIKYSGIVLEFETEDIFHNDTDAPPAKGEWNNMETYPWIYLSDADGWGNRLTRRSKEEITRRLGYTEPFDWMDDEWREVIAEYRQDISLEKETLKKAWEIKDEVLFNETLVKMKRKKSGYDKDIEAVLWEASSETVYRIGHIAIGYLGCFGGEKTVEKIIGEMTDGYKLGCYSHMKIWILGEIARRGIMRDRIIDVLLEYVMRSPRGADLPEITTVLNDFEEYGAVEKLKEDLARLTRNKDLKELTDEWGSERMTSGLMALFLYGEKGERYFCEILQGMDNVNARDLRKIVGYRLAIKDDAELKKLCVENMLTPDKLFSAKDPRNKYTYFHGTLLGLVKTAIETKSGLLGRNTSANITIEKGMADFWSKNRTDGQFMSDDYFEETMGYTALEELMSPETLELPEKVRRGGITLEFQKENALYDDEKYPSGGGERNNEVTYPWIYLSDTQGWGNRLTRSSKEEITLRLGYTEPFEWMDGEWLDVIAINKKKMADLKSAVKSLHEAIDRNAPAAFNRNMEYVKYVGKNAVISEEEIESILLEALDKHPYGDIADIATGYLSSRFGMARTAERMVTEIRDGKCNVDTARAYRYCLIKIAERGWATRTILNLLSDYFNAEIKSQGKSLPPELIKIGLFLVSYSFFGPVENLTEMLREKQLEELKNKNAGYYSHLETLAVINKHRFSSLIESLVNKNKNNEGYIRDIYKSLILDIFGSRSKCQVTEEEFLTLCAEKEPKIYAAIGKIMPDPVTRVKDDGGIVTVPPENTPYYCKQDLELVRKAIEQNAGLIDLTGEIEIVWDRSFRDSVSAPRVSAPGQEAGDRHIILEYEEEKSFARQDETAMIKWGSSYKWLYLSDAEGYGRRLTRKSKGEIVRRLGYTEPFDWMDNEWREVINEYRGSVPSGENTAQEGMAGAVTRGKIIEEMIMKIDIPEKLSRTLIEAVLSIMMQKKLVLAFDPNAGRAHKSVADMLAVFKELEKLKQEPKFSKLFENLVVIRDKATTEETVRAVKDHAAEKNTEVFVFARTNEEKAYLGAGGVSVHGAFIDEGQYAWEAYYYPLAEIVAITLVEFLDPGSREKAGAILEKINIEEITERDGKLIFRLIPRAEAYDVDGGFIERHKALANFVRAA